MGTGIYTLSRDFRFEAAHRLPYVPPPQKCHRLHGHSYCVTVTVEAPCDKARGMVMDYTEIRDKVNPIINEYLDHFYLNDIPGLENPTAENVARFIWQKLKPVLPELAEIALSETCQTRCRYFERRPS